MDITTTGDLAVVMAGVEEIMEVKIKMVGWVDIGRGGLEVLTMKDEVSRIDEVTMKEKEGGLDWEVTGLDKGEGIQEG